MDWFNPVAGLVKGLISPVSDYFRRKQELKEATHMFRLEMAKSNQTHTQTWELLQLENNGWKDDVLFYAMILMFVWAGFDPVGAKEFFTNLNVLPEWFVKTWFWVVASVVGVKKVGDYAPSLIAGVKTSLKGK
jgi:hypothetical protein